MNSKEYENTLRRNIALLSEQCTGDNGILPRTGSSLPSVESLRKFVDLVRTIVFPGFFDNKSISGVILSHHIGVNIENLYNILRVQIKRGLKFNKPNEESGKPAHSPEFLTLSFIDRLPEIKRLLYSDVEAMFNNDPAASNYGEVIFSYPVVNAMVNYRVAHELFKMGIPVIPRIITEMAHSATGIDIHPGAEIGEYFSIDHGTGVVIGETCVIGNHVTLYQGVTLGAKNFSLDSHGHPMNIPRHPILEDNVTVYSNSTILGRVVIGHDSIIGGNVWLTHGVPPGSKIIQGRPITDYFTDGLGI